MGFISEFKDFAMKGNVIDMAVGIVIGGAFGKIVSSFVGGVVMPAIGMLTGGVDFSKLQYVIQKAAPGTADADGNITGAVEEVAIRYGAFFNTVIDFIIIALAIFIVIKMMNSAKKRFEKEEEAAAPAAPPKQEVLLGEIRDLLKSRG